MSESTNSAVKSAPDPAPREESAVAQAPAGVAWRHVALFAFLSYAIAWALILPFIPNVFDLISADKPPAELDISIVPVFAMFAPMVAALVMRLFVSKEGLKGSLGPVRKWRFYGLALVLPAVLVTLAIGVVEASGWGDFTWDEDVPLPLEYIVLAVIAVTFRFGAHLRRGVRLARLSPPEVASAR